MVKLAHSKRFLSVSHRVSVQTEVAKRRVLGASGAQNEVLSQIPGREIPHAWGPYLDLMTVSFRSLNKEKI